jgi:hypothetical protein
MEGVPRKISNSRSKDSRLCQVGLLRLFLPFAIDLDNTDSNDFKQKATRYNDDWVWLEPPLVVAKALWL